MAITSASLANTIEPAILRIMDMDNPTAIQQSLRRTQLFNVIPSTTSTEEVVGLGSVSPDSWDVYRNTGVVGNASILEDFKTTFTNKDYPLNVEIPVNLIEDNKIDMINLLLTKVRNSLERKMEEDAASVFVNAFDSNFPIADAQPLCSNSHPFSPADTSTTQDNLSLLNLNYANIKVARTAMKKIVDHNNRRMFLMPNMAIVPVDLADQATEIRTAIGKPGTADNDGNAVESLVVMEWHGLTNTKDWFLVDSIAMKDALLWFNRGITEPMLVHMDTVRVIYQMKARYSFGAADWRWIYGHNVT